MVDPSVYTVGGTVQANDQGLYVQRQADGELLELCRRSTVAYVLTPRQMGKSSLMIRTAERLLEEGTQVVIIDLTQIGTQLSAAEWYQGLLTLVRDQLQLSVDVAEWWQSRQHLGVTQRLTQFFQEVVLLGVSSPIVIFIDEIDTTLSLKFTDDFFAAIRYLYVARAMQPELGRLSFVLIGVATPGDLIADAKRTPFNVGTRVDLTDFTLAEAMPLAKGLGSELGDVAEPEQRRVLGWVMDWTGGHPYLTQRLCQEMARVGGGWTEAEVSRLVSRTFFGMESERDNNLQFVRDMLTKRAPEPVAVMKTYRQVWWNKPVVPDEEQSLVKSHLKLAGVVKRVGKALEVRNPIYRAVFDGRWIKEQLPESWWRWQQLKPAMPIIATLLAAFIGMSGFAVYANQQRGIAEKALRSAEVAKQDAEHQTRLAKSAEERATDEAQKADKQRRDADQQRRNAKRQAQKATQQARIATQQQQRAEEQTQLANTQRRRAEDQTQVANELKQRSEEQSQLANEERQKAVRFAAVASLREKAAKSLNLLATPLQQVDGMVMAMQAVVESRKQKVVEVYSPVDSSLLSAIQLFREQNVLKGDTVDVTFSRDGQRIVSASRDGTTLLWDLNGNVIEHPVHHAPRNTDEQRILAVSPDGYILSTSNDNTLRLWDLEGNLIGKPFEGHKKEIIAAAFSPDGKNIVSGGGEHTLRLWDLEGNLIGKPFEGHTWFIRAVSFSPDGQYIVSGSGDWSSGSGSVGEVRLWDLQGRAIEAPFKGHKSMIMSVAFSLDGKNIASGGDDHTVRLWNLKGELVGKPFEGHTGDVLSVAFSPDGKHIVSGSDDRTLRLWDLNGRPSIKHTFQGHTGSVRSVVFSRDSQRIVSGSSDGTVRLWGLQGNAIGQPFLENTDSVESVASPDGQRIISLNSDGTLRLWDLEGNAIGQPFKGHTGVISSVAFSPDGQRIVSGSNDGTLRLWDLEGNPIGQPFEGHTGVVLSVAFSPEGQRIVSGSNDNTLRLWDLEGNPIGQPFKADTTNIVEFGQPLPTISSVSFSSNGQRIVSGSDDGTVRLWDLEGNAIGQPFLGQTGSVRAVAVSPDGQRIISGSGDGTVRLWDLEGNAIGKPSLGHTGSVLSVAFSPNGQRIVSGGSDNTVRLWDLQGNPIGHPFQGEPPLNGYGGGVRLAGKEGESAYIQTVAFSPDSQRIVSSNNGGMVRLWDLQGNPIGQSFLGLTESVNSVAFSSDERRIVVSGDRKTLRLWHGSWQGWLKAACTQLHDHPVLRDPEQSFDPVVAKGAKAACDQRVWETLR